MLISLFCYNLQYKKKNFFLLIEALKKKIKAVFTNKVTIPLTISKKKKNHEEHQGQGRQELLLKVSQSKALKEEGKIA